MPARPLIRRPVLQIPADGLMKCELQGMLKRPPRITLGITELDHGGAEKTLVRLAIGLQNRGWGVDVVSLRNLGALAEPLTAAGIDVSALRCRGIADVRCLWRFRRHLMKRRPDVLLTFLHQASLYGRLAARWAGIRTIVCGIRVADRRRIVTVPERFTHRLVHHYIACGPSVAAAHARLCGIRSDRISAIFNGVEPVEVKPEQRLVRADFGIPGDACLLLFVGRITRQKGLGDLLRALAIARVETPRSLFLLIAGDGPDREAEERAACTLDVGEQCRFLGNVSNPWPFYAMADVVVIPSRWEGTPNVMLEALASGRPVIASAVDGADDIGNRYPGVQLCRPHNIDDLAEQIVTTVSEIDAATARCRQTQHSIAKELTWDVMIDSYDQTLRSLAINSVSQQT